MDLKHAKILLKKINTLNDSLSLDNGSIASIERDLMLSYVRQLYEAYLDGPAQQPQANPKGTRTNAMELEVTASTEADLSRMEREPKPEPPKRKYTPPKIIEIPDTPPEPAKTSYKAEPPSAPKPTTSPTERKKVVSPPPVATSSAPTTKSHAPNPKVQALFSQREAKELSERLSLSPIKDLTKGLSINDRLLYTNDLFKKDTNLFNSILKTLNEMPDMKSAQSFLEEQAAKYNWVDGEKADVARDFIKHVRRRYV